MNTDKRLVINHLKRRRVDRLKSYMEFLVNEGK